MKNYLQKIAAGLWTVGVVVLLTGCGRLITPTPVGSQPSSTPTAATTGPTATPRPTSTPRPATPIPTATPTVTPTPIVYTVQSGDTLLKIALQFDISTEAIQEVNGIVDPRFLQIGQALIIPRGEQNQEATPTPTPTPFPLSITAINFQQTAQGTLWCLGTVSNPGDVPLAEVVVEAALFDANGVLLAREAAFTQLDVVLPEQSAPFAILFNTPPGEFAQYQVIPVSAVPLSGDSRYYFDLEIFDVRGTPEGIATYRVTGQLRNFGGQDAESIRLVVMAYDDADRVLAQRQVDLSVSVLRAGATTPFEVEMIIPAGSVARVEVLVQGLVTE